MIDIIQMRVDISGLPGEPNSITGLSAEMKLVLKRTLLRLSDGRIEGLRIRGVSECHAACIMPSPTEMKCYYDVHVIDGRIFGPIIIQQIRENYDGLIYEIQ